MGAPISKFPIFAKTSNPPFLSAGLSGPNLVVVALNKRTHNQHVDKDDVPGAVRAEVGAEPFHDNVVVIAEVIPALQGDLGGLADVEGGSVGQMVTLPQE